MSEIIPVTHTEKVVAGQVDAVTHFEKVIAKYGGGNVYESLEAGANILIEETADGKAKISASGEVSSEDTVARAAIAEMKDGTNIDSFGDVETALATKANTATTYTKTEVDTALSAKANAADVYSKSDVDTALGGKVDKETGKGLSTNDYTTAEKTKLAGIAEGAEVNVQSNWTQTTTTADDYIKNKPTLGTAAALDVAASGNASTSQVVKGNDTRLSDARNAADVSAWAKAANKPSYAGSEIALTGYSEAQSKASVAATDTTNEAIGKLEYRVETNENNILIVEKNLSAKNHLNSEYADTQTGSPINGVTYTKQSDGSYKATGTPSATSRLILTEANPAIGYLEITPYNGMVFSCLTATGSGTTFAADIIYYNDSNVYVNEQHDYGSGIIIAIPDTATKAVIRISVYTGAGQDINLTFKPMICDKPLWDAGYTDYKPYEPTNAELWAMIKAIQ